MPKVTQEYKQQVRERIILAARTCFIERGFQRTAMSEIIKEVGLSAGAIYNHFSGKEEIMVEAARIDLDLFQPGDKQPLPWDYVLTCLDTLEANPSLCRLLLASWGEAATVEVLQKVADEQLGEIKNRALSLYRQWAEQNLDFSPQELDDWLEVIGVAVLSVLTGFVAQSQILSQHSPESYRQYASTILRQA